MISNKNVRVCLMTSTHPALDDRIFHKEALTLAAAGYEVSLIAPHPQDEVREGIRIVAFPRPETRWARITGVPKKIFQLALKEKASIYHFHDPDLIRLASKLKKKTGARVIYDVHEDIPQQILSKLWIPRAIRRPLAVLFNFFEKSVSKKFDLIIAATPGIRDKFKNHPSVDIKNYPRLSYLPTSKVHKSGSDGFIVIYAGALEKVRGIREIIQSLGLINSRYKVKLILIGEFSEAGFRREVEELSGWEKVVYAGWIPHKEIFEHLSQADAGLVCLHPLKRFLTALPVKMFEYMGAGLPVIASNFPLWQEIVEGNGCGICINPLDSKEIARAVEFMIKNPDEAQKMAENGRRAVLEKYNWEKEDQRLLKAYEELLT